MGEAGPRVVALQPVAVIDHVVRARPQAIGGLGIEGDLGGSKRVSARAVQELLVQAGGFTTKAGGSAANTCRSLAQGFQVPTALVGAVGTDEWGVMFQQSLERAGVRTSDMEVREGGVTGRCVVVSCEGQRTMRTNLEEALRADAGCLSAGHMEGAEWFLISGYSFFTEGLVEAALAAAEAAGCRVALDLASFEVVRTFRDAILALVRSGRLALVICNEDEATALAGAEKSSLETSEVALELLTEASDLAVVTLGSAGCIARKKGDGTVTRQAAYDVIMEDSTGAGDSFSAGLLFGLLQGYDLKRCCEIACLAGGAVVQNLGAEVSEAGWQWMHAHMHGDLAANVARSSAAAVQKELLQNYTLIDKLGRGVVYYGSARLKESSPYWDQAVALGRDVAAMLGSTTWSGGGPGMMEAATRGALQAGGEVGGIRIEREAGQIVRLVQGEHYLPKGHAAFCKYLSPRKVALVDAGVRQAPEDRTAYIFLPGGLGTMDEFFELLTLIQLKKLGTEKPVPLVLCNWDGFYSNLQDFLARCVVQGVVGEAEFSHMKVFDTSQQVLEHLAEVYEIPRPARAA